MAFVIVFIAFLDNTAQQPLISPLAETLGASGPLIGSIFAAYSIANIVGNLLVPRLVAQHGLKRVLFVAFPLVGVSLALYGGLRSPMQMLLLRFFHGCAGGIVVPAVFSYISCQKQYGISMSTVGRIIGLAAVLGPPIAGVLSGRWGYTFPFILIALLYFLAAPLILQLPNRPDALESVSSFGAVWSESGLRIAYASAFALMFAMGMLGYWFPLQMKHADMTGSAVGLCFLAFGASAMAVMRKGAVLALKEPTAIIGAGFIGVFAGMALLSKASGLLPGAIGMMVYGVGFGFVFPAMNILVVQETGAEHRTRAFAVFHGFFSLAVLSASILGGISQRYIHPFHLVLAVLLLLSAAFVPLGMSRNRQRAVG